MSDIHIQNIFRTSRQLGKSTSLLTNMPTKELLTVDFKDLPIPNIKHFAPPGIMGAVIEWGEPWRSELSVLRKRAGLAEPVSANFNVDHALADLRKRLGYGGTSPTGPTGAQGSQGSTGVQGSQGSTGVQGSQGSKPFSAGRPSLSRSIANPATIMNSVTWN